MRKLSWMVCIAIGALTAPAALAQAQQDPAAAVRAEAARLRNSIRRDERELGFTEVKLRTLDGKIEDHINDLVKRVTEAKESVATDERMAAVKEQVIVGLRRIIDVYVKEREKNRNQGWSTEALDGKIDLRLDQMTKLVATLSTGQNEAEPLRPVGEGYDMEEALAALKAGKPTGHVVANRKDMVRELEAVVEFLSERQKWLELQLPVTTDEQDRIALQQRIAEQAALIAKRRAQIQEAKNAPRPEKTKIAGVQTVSDFEKELFRTKGPLRADFRELIEVKSKRDYQRKNVEYQRKQLAQAEATLAKMAVPEK